jgi:hypothetical protein
VALWVIAGNVIEPFPMRDSLCTKNPFTRTSNLTAFVVLPFMRKVLPLGRWCWELFEGELIVATGTTICTSRGADKPEGPFTLWAVTRKVCVLPNTKLPMEKLLVETVVLTPFLFTVKNSAPTESHAIDIVLPVIDVTRRFVGVVGGWQQHNPVVVTPPIKPFSSSSSIRSSKYALLMK